MVIGASGMVSEWSQMCGLARIGSIESHSEILGVGVGLDIGCKKRRGGAALLTSLF